MMVPFSFFPLTISSRDLKYRRVEPINTKNRFLMDALVHRRVVSPFFLIQDPTNVAGVSIVKFWSPFPISCRLDTSGVRMLFRPFA